MLVMKMYLMMKKGAQHPAERVFLKTVNRMIFSTFGPEDTGTAVLHMVLHPHTCAPMPGASISLPREITCPCGKSVLHDLSDAASAHLRAAVTRPWPESALGSKAGGVLPSPMPTFLAAAGLHLAGRLAPAIVIPGCR
jgi:hypothetical protein